jgi:ankyrin repeat protein
MKIPECEMLILAAEEGDLSALREAIGMKGAKVDYRNPETGWTALHRAARFGHAEIASALLRCGANPNARDNRQLTPLHDSAQGLLGSVAAMKLLLDAGADIEARDSYGKTPVLAAVQYSNLAGFLFLLGASADISVRDADGVSAHDMVRILLAAAVPPRKYREQRREIRGILHVLTHLQGA